VPHPRLAIAVVRCQKADRPAGVLEGLPRATSMCPRAVPSPTSSNTGIGRVGTKASGGGVISPRLTGRGAERPRMSVGAADTQLYRDGCGQLGLGAAGAERCRYGFDSEEFGNPRVHDAWGDRRNRETSVRRMAAGETRIGGKRR
jgi:hypothetical protein